MSAPPISRPVGTAFPPRRSSLPSPHLRLRCRRRTSAPKGARRRRVDCRHEAVDVGNGGAAVHVHRLLGGTPPEAGVAGAGLALHEQASARRPVGPMRRAERAGMYALVGRGGGRLIRGGGRDRLARLCCCRCLGRCRKGGRRRSCWRRQRRRGGDGGCRGGRNRWANRCGPRGLLSRRASVRVAKCGRDASDSAAQQKGCEHEEDECFRKGRVDSTWQPGQFHGRHRVVALRSASPTDWAAIHADRRERDFPADSSA